MIKYLLGLSILFSTQFIVAQVTLTASSFPAANDTVRMSKSNDFALDYVSTGANFNWDFSSLLATSQYVRQYHPIGFASILIFTTYGPLASSPYRASYFNTTQDLPLDQLSQFLPVTLSDLNQYTKSNNDSITSIGYSISVNGQGVPFKSDTIETRYKLPLNFNDQHFSRGYSYIDLNPIIDVKFKQYRQRHTTVDGWGSLTTPKGTFAVLRIKHEIDEIDSVYQTFFGAGTWFGTPPIARTEYEWFGLNKKEWLLKAVLTNGNVTSVEYQQDYLGLDAGIQDLDLNNMVYPNPVIDFLNIENSTDLESVVIFDLKGKVIAKYSTLELQQGRIDMRNFTSGYYLVQLNSSQSSKIVHLIKD
jgi:hypothetical protein